MIHDRTVDALAIATGIGMAGGVIMAEVQPWGILGLAIAAIGFGVGLWLAPDAETIATLYEERGET